MAVDVRQLAPLLEELDDKIDRLRIAYEKYYLGLEASPPEVERQAIARAFAQMQGTHVGNTALKFRYHSLLQKWATYQQYWSRVAREIEAGTYIRHVQRLRRREQAEARERAARDPALRPGEVAELVDAIDAATHASEEIGAGLANDAADEYAAAEITLGDAPSPLEFEAVVGTGVGARPPAIPARDLEVAVAAAPREVPERDEDIDGWLDSQFQAITAPIKSTAPVAPPPARASNGAAVAPPPVPPAPRPGRATVPPVAPAGGSPPPGPPPRAASPPDLDRVYQRYLAAREKLGERAGAPSRDAFTRSLEKQLPALLAKHRAGVDFDVVVRDGKAVVKAVPRR